ncbi:MAG: biotin--[acetyl-CoA-carboxylase] ligase [Puniceicoccaceae bacterium]
MRADSSEVLILRALLGAGTGFLSGEALAGRLGISRVAVWKRIETLKRRGHAIEAVRRRGYRLVSPAPEPTEAGILARVGEGFGLRSLVLRADSPSTNDDAARLLAAGEEAPFACLTRRQPGGRGRRGRAWSGASEGNLYASLAFRPDVHPRALHLLPIRAGLHICRRLGSETGLRPGLKWPNDILLGGKKIAGMLAESTLETDRVTALVFGVGLNVNLSRDDLPEDLRATATSLAIEAGRAFALEPIAAAVLEEVLRAERGCRLGLDEDRLADDWAELACHQGETVEIRGGDGSVRTGTLAGIDRAGSLLLRAGDGTIQSYRAGDVSLRAAPRRRG